MKVLKYPLKAIDTLLDRVSAVVGSILCSQIPAFIGYYLQRLGGHVDEAQRNVDEWQKIADKISGGSMDALLKMGTATNTEFGIEAANKCTADVARLADLMRAFEALQDATVWNRGIVFLKHADMSIARSAGKSFVPNVPMDPEGLVYAVVGLLLGIVIYFCLKLLFKSTAGLIRKKLSRKKDEPEAPAPDPA